jgi:hypothetical protein
VLSEFFRISYRQTASLGTIIHIRSYLVHYEISEEAIIQFMSLNLNDTIASGH